MKRWQICAKITLFCTEEVECCEGSAVFFTNLKLLFLSRRFIDCFWDIMETLIEQ